jgi:hypothetical protein
MVVKDGKGNAWSSSFEGFEPLNSIFDWNQLDFTLENLSLTKKTIEYLEKEIDEEEEDEARSERA